MPATTPAALYAAHAAFVFRSLVRLGVRRADAPDATQQVFLVVMKKVAGFDGRASVKAWLFGICRRVAADHRARASTQREVSSAQLPDEPVAPGQHAAFERRQARAWLQRLVDGLNEDRRDVFVLYELEGCTMPEVAEMLGIPLQTAYSRFNAAKRDLEAQARQDLAPGECS
jgi:RNA polymerase sigma-70 factor (ECF subfamily)